MGATAMPQPTLITSHIIIGELLNDSLCSRLIRRLLEMGVVEPGAIVCRGCETPEMAVIQASISQGSGLGNWECRLAGVGQVSLPQRFVERPFQVKKRIFKRIRAAFKIAAP